MHSPDQDGFWWSHMGWILTELGYKIQEPEYTKDNTRCCGFGGMVVPANPDIASRVIKRRIEDGDPVWNNPTAIDNLVSAIEELRTAVTAYHRDYGCVPGDWMNFNLMLDARSGRILNVDLEGFFTRRGDFRGEFADQKFAVIMRELDKSLPSQPLKEETLPSS